MMDHRQEKKLSPFRREWRSGWRNLVAATVGIGFGISCFTPVSSMFRHSIETEFGWSKTLVAGALISQPLTALFFPFAGRLVDRFGVRYTTLSSVLAIILCYLALSLMTSISDFYLAMIGLEVLGCISGPIAYTRLVAGQFHESRGFALAIAQAGIAVLAIGMPPLIAMVISHEGWRAGFVLFAVVTLCGGLAAQALMRPLDISAAPANAIGVSPWEALSSSAFWILASSILLISIAAFGFVAQFQSVIIDRGLPPTMAVMLLPLLGFSGVLSRLLVGRLLDLSSPTTWSAIVIAVAALGGLLLVLPFEGTWILAVAVLLFGVSIGAELDLMSFFCARQFGLLHYGTIYGFLSMFFRVGIALGGISFSFIRDHTGSYQPALVMATCMLGISAILFLALGKAGSPLKHGQLNSLAGSSGSLSEA